MATTARGVPYPTPADPNDVPADLQALAEWVSNQPGVATLTTTQRDALSGAALWNGRLIFNSTTSTYQRYNGATWDELVSNATSAWSQAVDLPSIAANSTAFVSVTSTQPLTTGDRVGLLGCDNGDHGLVIRCYGAAIATDTIRLVVSNFTGSAINPASETYSFIKA
jgi:hypothetical protein